MPTDEAVIRRLAEMRGWKMDTTTTLPGHYWITVPGESRRAWWVNAGDDDRCWNPLESIADAHECMLDLPEEKRDEFIRQLLRPMGLTMLDLSAARSAVYATPCQLSMAMYAALEAK